MADERPEKGQWVQVWGQVETHEQTHPEDTRVRMESHNEDYVVHVRTDRLRVCLTPPPFARICTALYNAGGGLLWRCSQTENHNGSHISNGGSLVWGAGQVHGYFEER